MSALSKKLKSATILYEARMRLIAKKFPNISKGDMLIVENFYKPNTEPTVIAAMCGSALTGTANNILYLRGEILK